MDIGEFSLVGVGEFLALFVEDVLVPAQLRKVKFYLQGAECLEVLLAGQAEGCSEGRSHEEILLDGGIEAHTVHVDTGIETYGDGVTCFADLGMTRSGSRHTTEDEEYFFHKR
ncbi:hypothetical protein EVA_02197 [gut metagenome]|uniref:Uncharacterized protein n=1 Tax=gut metagenome TaxID=749906 RepID=J9GPN5_9ZZZZ